MLRGATYAEGAALVTPRAGRPTALGKSVDGAAGKPVGDLAVEKDTDGGGSGSAPVQRDGEKKAGVESFTTAWSQHPGASPTNARLRLDYKARFKKDDKHDPALAEFRQNVMTKFEITAGTHKGAKGDNSPMHDDNYSRADDTGGHTINDVEFVSNDNPGLPSIAADDVLNYAFTAEQMIIDTSDGNKVIARQGPHTGTITGAAPRTHTP